MKWLAASVLLMAALSSKAQVNSVQPPNPTSVDNVILGISLFQADMTLQPLVFDGSEIRITFRGGSAFPVAGSQSVALGHLPGGTYSVIVVFENTEGGDVVLSTVTLPPFTLVVAAGYFVPTLHEVALLGLAAMLAVFAVLAMRR